MFSLVILLIGHQDLRTGFCGDFYSRDCIPFLLYSWTTYIYTFVLILQFRKRLIQFSDLGQIKQLEKLGGLLNIE